jgi:hypothetical protein
MALHRSGTWVGGLNEEVGQLGPEVEERRWARGKEEKQAAEWGRGKGPGGCGLLARFRVFFSFPVFI